MPQPAFVRYALATVAWVCLATPAAAQTPLPEITISVPGNTIPRQLSRPVTVFAPGERAGVLDVTLTLGGTAADASARLSQTTVSFAPHEQFKTLTLFAGSALGTLEIGGTAHGPGAEAYSGVRTTLVSVQTNLTLFQSGQTVYARSTVHHYRIAVPSPEPFDVRVTLSGDGADGASLAPEVASFPAGTTSVAITLTAGQNLGTIILTPAITGPGAAYVTGNPSFILVAGTTSVSGLPAFLTPGETAAHATTLRLSHPAPVAQSIQVRDLSGSGASFTPSTLTFEPGESTKTFTVTAGTRLGTLQIGFAPGGPLQYQLPPGPHTVTVGAAAPTAVGSNVSVSPPVPAGTSAKPITVTFSDVTQAGHTQHLPFAGAFPASPSGYAWTGRSFAVKTTAGISGPVMICSEYQDGLVPDETALRLFVRTNAPSWADTTTSVDPAANVICGAVDSFSDGTASFGLFRVNAPPTAGTPEGPGPVVATGELVAFSAVVSDPNTHDTLTGTWYWGDGSSAPATIVEENGTRRATGEHAYSSGGTYQVALVVSDGPNHARSPELTLIVDGAPPEIHAVTATPGILWPPNGQMHDVRIDVDATDDSGTPSCTVTDAGAAGMSADDVVRTGDRTLAVRAAPNKRTYTITVTCTDAVGRTAGGATTVVVTNPKNPKG